MGSCIYGHPLYIRRLQQLDMISSNSLAQKTSWNLCYRSSFFTFVLPVAADNEFALANLELQGDPSDPFNIEGRYWNRAWLREIR